MNEWMNELINKWMNEWMNERMNKWMNEWMNEWMKDWINEWTNEWKNEWMFERMNERMNEWMNERMNERMNEWTNEWKNEWKNEWMNERTNEWMNGRMNERMNMFLCAPSPLCVRTAGSGNFIQAHSCAYMAKLWCSLAIENYMFRPVAAIIRLWQLSCYKNCISKAVRLCLWILCFPCEGYQPIRKTPILGGPVCLLVWPLSYSLSGLGGPIRNRKFLPA